MRRREFLSIVGMAAASPRAAFAQQQRIPLIGFVGFATPEVDNATLAPFRKAMAEFGYVEGRNIVIDARSTGGDVARGLALIDELIARPVDVLLSPGPAAARAIVKKTNIPVVAVALPAVQSDADLFQRLARPAADGAPPRLLWRDPPPRGRALSPVLPGFGRGDVGQAHRNASGNLAG